MNDVAASRVREVDHVVVGLGGLGSGAAYWLARLSQEAGLDASVVGIEQFELGHDKGASHDHSRIIRHSYHTPYYVAITRGAYDALAEVAEEAGEEIVVKTGGLDLFPAGGSIDIAAYTTSMTAEGIEFETIDAAEVMRRYPQFKLADDVTALFQADTGIAPAAKGTAAHQRLAAARGVEIHDNTAVLSIVSDGRGQISVVTAEATYRTGSLVVCADGWTNDVLSGLGVHIPLEVTREQVVYYPSEDLDAFQVGVFPVWLWMDEPCFYGFPVYGDTTAVKAAEDVGGLPTTPQTRDFEPNLTAQKLLTEFLETTLPAMVGTSPPRVKTCLYAMTPDRDFVLDTVPGHPGVQVALGSAHGFKFASWFGRTLAERAIHGSTSSDISHFVFDRPGLTDPDYVTNYFV